MNLHDDPMLDVALSSPFGMTPTSRRSSNGGGHSFGNGFAPMVPGVTTMDPDQQSFPSVEEYAALVGIKLEMDNNDHHLNGPAPPATPMNQFGLNQPAPTPTNMSKAQANAAYFEKLYRESYGMMEGLDGNGNNITSMTLPAGVGSGASSGNLYGPSPAATPTNAPPTSTALSNSELAAAFTGMNHRPYDPNADFLHSSAAGHLHMQKMAHAAMPTRNVMHSQHDLGAQTLSPEILSSMIKHSNPTMRSFDNLNEEEKAALLKEEKSRERNRDHSRKSRLRKKEFVENLKQENADLKIYRQICEQCMDLMALVTSEPSAVFLFTSSSYARVLGYQSHQLVTGKTSFLEHVHPDHMTEVRSIFQKFTTVGESYKFKFRIKAADGNYFNAETSARKAEKGIVCSTRVDRDHDSIATMTA